VEKVPDESDYLNGPDQEAATSESVEKGRRGSRHKKSTRRKKKSRPAFGPIFTYSVLTVLLAGMGSLFYLGHQYLKAFQEKFEIIDNRLVRMQENFQQETLNINEQIDEIEYIVNNLEEERKRLLEEIQSLKQEKDQLKQEQVKLEGENRQLRNLLSWRYRTYQTAVNRQGKYMYVISKSGFSATQIDRAWRNLGAYNLVGTGTSFIEAENRTGVNALVMAAIAAHESAFGCSRIAQDKKNLYGFGAFDHDPYTMAYTFRSYHEGTMTVASYLSRNYLTAGGRYYRGNTLVGIGIHYATDQYWADKVSNMMKVIAEASADIATVAIWKRYL
jgi:beta-N-acetylglucosaminidase